MVQQLEKKTRIARYCASSTECSKKFSQFFAKIFKFLKFLITKIELENSKQKFYLSKTKIRPKLSINKPARSLYSLEI